MKAILQVPLFVLLCGSVLLWTTGCEDSPNTDGVGDFFEGVDLSSGEVSQTSFAQQAAPLTPDQEELVIGPAGDLVAETDGQIVEITLSGADGSVAWDVAFSDRGRLITRSATVATYRRDSSGDNVVSATDSSGRSVAKVIQQPAVAPPADDDDDDGPLEIAGPTDPVILEEDGNIAGITLSGAVGSVTWSVSYPGRGRIVSGTASSTGATYRRDSSGDNVVTATDEEGRMVNIVIRQPSE